MFGGIETERFQVAAAAVVACPCSRSRGVAFEQRRGVGIQFGKSHTG